MKLKKQIRANQKNNLKRIVKFQKFISEIRPSERFKNF